MKQAHRSRHFLASFGAGAPSQSSADQAGQSSLRELDGFDTFLREMARYPLINKAEEQRLGWRQIVFNEKALRMLLVNDCVARLSIAQLKRVVEDRRKAFGVLKLSQNGTSSAEVIAALACCAAAYPTLKGLQQRCADGVVQLVRKKVSTRVKEKVHKKLTQTRYKVARLVLESKLRDKFILSATTQVKSLADLTLLLQRMLSQGKRPPSPLLQAGCREYLQWRGNRLDKNGRVSLEKQIAKSLHAGELVPELRREIRRAIVRNILVLSESPRACLARISRAEGYLAESVRARNDLAKANLRLVVAIAKESRGRGGSLDDLVCVGNIGLLRACEKYEPWRNLKFSTYAAWWIKQQISRHQEDFGRTIRVPAHAQAQIRAISRAREQLSSELGRAPELEESYQHYRTIEVRKPLSFQEYNSLLSVWCREVELDGLESSASLLRCRKPGPVAVALENNRKEQLQHDVSVCLEILATTLPRYAEILRARFGLDGEEPKTRVVIGQQYGLTGERIRQIENRALEKFTRLFLSMPSYRDLPILEQQDLIQKLQSIIEEDALSARP
jgi:RNA polymerase primary sigma factor